MQNQLFTQLDVKEAAILHKYMTAAGHQIQAEDACKSQNQEKNSDEALSNLFYIFVRRDQAIDRTPAAP